MEQLDFFEIVKFIFAALAAFSAHICFSEDELSLSWKRFFRGLFVFSLVVLIIFPINFCIDDIPLRYVVNFLLTGATVIGFALVIVFIIITSSWFFSLIKNLWEWIKVSD
ncbi:MAG: hypothetical protein ACI4OW_00635 [Alphaproteobacteria bacterium]